MDRITATQQRLSYAKICIEIGAAENLSRIIDVKMKDGSFNTVFVDIPWFLSRCSNCHIFGHTDKTCTKKAAVQVAKVWVAKKEVKTVDSTLGDPIEMKEQVVTTHIDDNVSSKKSIAARAGSANKFAILNSVDNADALDDSVGLRTEQEVDMVLEVEDKAQRHSRVTSAGVTELIMKSLKPRKKEPVDKRKKVKAGLFASGSKFPTPSQLDS
ncbi:hypothetical protein DITRI_Ditri07aG0103300 [Diplodiscus trichospermus]